MPNRTDNLHGEKIQLQKISEKNVIDLLTLVSSTFAISAFVSLTPLALSVSRGNSEHDILLYCKFLWVAIILFSLTLFRCVDYILDNYSKVFEECNNSSSYILWSWPKKSKRQTNSTKSKTRELPTFIELDKRLLSFGGAIFTFLIGWIFFIIAMYYLGTEIGLYPLWKNLGIVAMSIFTLFYTTRKILFIQ